MAGYLDQYGIGDERRGRIVKRTLLAILVALLVALALYLFFKDYPEEQAAKHFLSEVNAGQLQTAYQTWGCSEAHPCPNYIYQKFLEDWSKKSGASGDWTISKVEGCNSGVIVTVSAPGATSVLYGFSGATNPSASHLGLNAKERSGVSSNSSIVFSVEVNKILFSLSII